MQQEQISGFSLSSQQRCLWLQQQRGGGLPENSECRIRITGTLDEGRLQRAIESVVARHEILRTSFVSVPGMRFPLQVVAAMGDGQAGYGPGGLCAQAAGQGREVGTGGLRARLTSTAAGEHSLSLLAPALCLDAQSCRLLLGEIAASYANRCERPAGAAEPLQYADYAASEEEFFETGAASLGRAYWRSILIGLPDQRTATAARGIAANFQIVSATLPPEVVARIDAITASHRVPALAVPLACWAILISRSAYGFAPLVTYRHSGRGYAELDAALGLFEKYLPVPFNLRPELRFTTLLAELAAALAEHEKWHLSYAADSDDGAALTSPSFRWDEEAWSGDGGDVVFAEQSIAAVSPRGPLDLSCKRAGGAVELLLTFDTSVCSAADARALAGRFQTILRQVCEAPAILLASIHALAEAERALLLAAGEGDAVPRAELFVELFGRQARVAGDRVAVACDGRWMTYSCLDACSDHLAHRLLRSDVDPEFTAGVLMHRRPEALISLLAVLKAGGAFVPLDPSYPTPHVEFMLEDAGVRILLTTNDLSERLPNVILTTICVDRFCATYDHEVEPPHRLAEPQNLAYIMYTSGSSGRPKGVMVTQAGLANYVSWAAETYRLFECSGSVVHSSLSFDLTLTGLLVPLVAGAAVTLVPEVDPMQALIGTAAISDRTALVKLTPGQLQVIREQLPLRRRPQFASILVIGGEALSWEELEPWMRQSPALRMVNEYGPTETVVGCCIYTAKGTAGAGPVPIGRPIANTRLLVMGEWGELLPAGTAGELYIGGAGLARGYHNQPQQTAERFLPDALSGHAGERVYRSGDRVRWRADEQLEYMGRLDGQVKLRGYRVELGAVEAVLMQHAAVRQCAVLVKEEGAGGKRLVAYLVPSGEGAASHELRDFLRSQLPEYMVPSAFVELPELPLTANGKVDRKALLEAAEGASDGSRAPRTPVEEIVAGIFAEVLRRAEVGVEEHFFELGGHSLLATQVVSRIREALEVEIPLRTFFETPTVAQLAEVVERQRHSGKGVESPPIVAVGRERELPLSYAQQRLWFIQQLEPESVAYNILLAVRLFGVISLPLLRQSLGEIVRRHEVLRTRFVSRDGRPLQVIAAPCEVSVKLCDLSRLAEEQRAAYAREVAAEEAGRPFDLERGPVWRATALRLAEREYVLLVSLHHVTSDGWSTGLLVKEFTTLHEDYRAGAPPSLPDLAVQYADFAVWQREWLQGATLGREINYWREQLAGAAVLELPLDRPRPAVAAHRGGEVRHRLSAELSESLRELSRREGVTLFMTLLAGFQVLLGRYTGQDDVVVGTDVANRNRLEVETLIGFFVNQLVLRTDLSGDLSFSQLLRRVRESALGAYMYQDLPFERLVEELAPDRDLTRTPLFQVTMALANAEPAEAVVLSGVQLSPFDYEAPAAKFDLALTVVEEGAELEANASYDADLFDSQTVARMLRHLECLLESVAADPQSRIDDLNMLTAAETWQLVGEWNDTNREYPEEECFRHLFERMAERRPDAVAVSHQGQWVSYRELNHKANLLACALAVHGVGPEVSVGVLTNRDLDLLISIIALFKTGGVYVPLDPHYPAERLQRVLSLSQSRLILSSGEHASNLEQLLDGRTNGHRPPVLRLEEVLRWQVEVAASVSGSVARQLAYIIFTSGSTGAPKGVMIEHRGMLNHLYAKINTLSLDEQDIIAETASQSFDISVWQLLAALLVGGRTHIVDEEAMYDPVKLLGEVSEKRVTVLEVVPSLLRPMLGEAAGRPELRAGSASLKALLVTGEALPSDLCCWWLMSSQGIPLVNAYGPTECSDDVTHERFERPPAGDKIRIPVGRPLANTHTQVIDRAGRLAPIGVEGELWVGGDGVGRGYFGDAAQTAMSFVPDSAGARRYRTGDRTRYRADGRIDFLGRIDHQIKIRGYRVELGEIEAVLALHPDIKQAVVIAAGDERGAHSLVGYLIARAGTLLSARELRRYLDDRLPEYMVPSAFVAVESFPLTANGKLDRQALPPPPREAQPDIEGPRTEAEATLASIWAEVLGLERVGRDQNFFELGGDSILSIHIVARARRAGLALTPRQMFQYQTVSELAEVVAGAQPLPAAQTLVTGPVPLTPVQTRFFSEARQRPHHFNQSSLLECKARVNPVSIAAAIRELLSHHDALRMRFARQESEWRQVNSADVESDCLRWIDLTRIEKQDRLVVSHMVAEALQASLDLERGPVLRVGGFEYGSSEPQRLLIVAHHLVIDTVSWQILAEDLETLYGQLLAGEPLRLPAKTTSYQQWAEALVNYRRSADLEAEADHWLATARQRARTLPRDFDGGNNTEESQAEITVELSRAETEQLVREVPKTYGGLLEVLVTALAESITGWSGDRGMLLELENHGREEELAGADLTRTVGWFTSIYPVWFPSAEGRSPRRYVERISQQLQAVVRQGIGYGVLRYLNAAAPVAQELGRAPRAEACFNYLGQTDVLGDRPAFFHYVAGPSGFDHDLNEQREWVFEVNCSISQSRFRLTWIYSRALHRAETVERLTEQYLAALRRMLATSADDAPDLPELNVVDFDTLQLEDILSGIRVRSGDASS